MTAESPVLIEVPESWDRVPAGVWVPLRMVLQRSQSQAGAVTIPFVNYAHGDRATVNTDLFAQEVTLQPGERYVLTLGVRFHSPGPASLSDFYVQANSEAGERTIVRLPDRPLQVVPSLAHQIDARVERICAYEQGIKVEVLLQHVGETPLQNLEVGIGPVKQVRAGVTRQRRALFKPGQQERLEVVLDGQSLELSLAATANEERIEDRRSLPIPAAEEGRNGCQPFTFLEPRALTTDRIIVAPADNGPEVRAQQGLLPLAAGQRYVVTIYPSHPFARDVNLLGAPGQIEVERMKAEGGAWSFMLTTINSSWLSQPVRLYYDVKTKAIDQTQSLRGELYLAVRPSSARLWAIAATAGAAVTLKTAGASLPALFGGDLPWDDLLADLPRLANLYWGDALQLFSIPLVRAGLWLVERLARPFQEV